jgi:hypothetical protein
MYVVTPHTWLVKSMKSSARSLHLSAVSMRRKLSKSSKVCEVAECTRRMSGHDPATLQTSSAWPTIHCRKQYDLPAPSCKKFEPGQSGIGHSRGCMHDHGIEAVATITRLRHLRHLGTPGYARGKITCQSGDLECGAIWGSSRTQVSNHDLR